jgi:hypothetical protein
MYKIFIKVKQIVNLVDKEISIKWKQSSSKNWWDVSINIYL